MEREQRRRIVRMGRRAAPFDPEIRVVEGGVRGRTARRVRALVRRLQTVGLVTPRWSEPQAFLEDIALDLAVGEPKVACRTVAFRPLMGRTDAECWNYLLRVLSELPGLDSDRRPVPMVAGRAAFQLAAAELVDRIHHDSPLPVALLGHGAEFLPVDIVRDLADIWAAYAAREGNERRSTLLLAGSMATPALSEGMTATLDLGDYAPAEAAATMVLSMGPVPLAVLQGATRFSGGVPAIVHALSAGVAEHAVLPVDTQERLKCLGPMADEIRATVTMALMPLDAAGRFYQLAEEGPLPEVPELDDPLRMVGLVRRVRAGAAPRVELRSPALALVAG